MSGASRETQTETSQWTRERLAVHDHSPNVEMINVNVYDMTRWYMYNCRVTQITCVCGQSRDHPPPQCVTAIW